MNEINNIKAKQINKIREVTSELIHNKKLKASKLANFLGLNKKQYSSFYKFTKGDVFPKYLLPEKILEEIMKLLEDADLLQKLKDNMVVRDNDYEMKQISHWVWIPFDLRLPVADYNGNNQPLSIIKIGREKGIVVFANASQHEAEGEIYIDHIGMATDIEPGTRIAIKRINKTDWQTDRYYVIIDTSSQISVWELLPGDDKKTVRYVSLSSPDGPHKELSLDRISAVFTIVGGTYIPKPKRTGRISSTSNERPFTGAFLNQASTNML